LRFATQPAHPIAGTQLIGSGVCRGRSATLTGVEALLEGETGHGDALDYLGCSGRLNCGRGLQISTICAGKPRFCEPQLDHEAQRRIARRQAHGNGPSPAKVLARFVVKSTGAAAQISLMTETFGRAYDDEGSPCECVALFHRQRADERAPDFLLLGK
jgi:hypothetical protein